MIKGMEMLEQIKPEWNPDVDKSSKGKYSMINFQYSMSFRGAKN
jgi:hypothetical protein